MTYHGKLYGKHGRAYIPLIMTSEDVDRLHLDLQSRERELAEVTAQRDALADALRLRDGSSPTTHAEDTQRHRAMSQDPYEREAAKAAIHTLQRDNQRLRDTIDDTQARIEQARLALCQIGLSPKQDRKSVV